MKPESKNISIAAITGAAFIVLVVAGSFFTSHHMNKTADDHDMSAGRSGDARPNLIQEQQNKKSTRDQSTTGALDRPTIPPAR
jgi:hypothetical protein